MKILEGSSDSSDALEAICEATDSWDRDAAPDILFVFHSSVQNAHAVATYLAERFQRTLIVGCTTAGEWLTGRHKNSALVLLAVTTPDIRWGVSVLDDLERPAADSAKAVCSELVQQLGVAWSDLNPQSFFYYQIHRTRAGHECCSRYRAWTSWIASSEVFRQHQHRVTGVLLDMTMPRMNGEDCFGELRKIKPDIKVILSSGYSAEDAMAQFHGKGLAGFIQKPNLIDRFQDTVTSCFSDSFDC